MRLNNCSEFPAPVVEQGQWEIAAWKMQRRGSGHGVEATSAMDERGTGPGMARGAETPWPDPLDFSLATEAVAEFGISI